MSQLDNATAERYCLVMLLLMVHSLHRLKCGRSFYYLISFCQRPISFIARDKLSRGALRASTEGSQRSHNNDKVPTTYKLLGPSPPG